jgi:hypothetical protein
MIDVWRFLTERPTGQIITTIRPPSATIVITREFCELRGLQGKSYVGWLIFWIFSYSAVASVLLIATLLSFNRCLGRVETGPDRYPRLGQSTRNVIRDREPEFLAER